MKQQSEDLKGAHNYIDEIEDELQFRNNQNEALNDQVNTLRGKVLARNDDIAAFRDTVQIQDNENAALRSMVQTQDNDNAALRNLLQTRDDDIATLEAYIAKLYVDSPVAEGPKGSNDDPELGALEGRLSALRSIKPLKKQRLQGQNKTVFPVTPRGDIGAGAGKVVKQAGDEMDMDEAEGDAEEPRHNEQDGPDVDEA